MHKLNFGCGKDIKQGFVNADLLSLPGVDISFDFDVFPYPFDDNSFDYILCDNVLEHLDNVPRVLEELYRVSIPGVLIRIIVPYYNCYGAHNDVTHRHYFYHRSFMPFYTDVRNANYYVHRKFDLHRLTLNPTRFGKIIPEFLRLPLSFFIGQVIQSIDIELKVVYP